MDSIQNLIDYHYWANHRMLSAIEELTEEQFTRDLSSSFPSIQATVAHMINAEGVWLGRFLGEPLPAVKPTDLPNPAAARERWAETERSLRTFAAGLQGDGLQKTFQMRTSFGGEFTHVRWEALLHIVNHGSYHRGQLATMLRQVGAAPKNIDLITYYRERSGQLAR